MIVYLMQEIGNTLQERGREFGVTTGRRRRCGWFDMVVARYCSMINGFTSITIAKLDVMDTLEEVKIGIAYKLDGKLLESMPRECATQVYIASRLWFVCFGLAETRHDVFILLRKL